jgi:hypothetical protein
LKKAVLPPFKRRSNMCFEDVRKITRMSVMTSNSRLVSVKSETEKLTLQNIYSYEQLCILNNI